MGIENRTKGVAAAALLAACLWSCGSDEKPQSDSGGASDEARLEVDGDEKMTISGPDGSSTIYGGDDTKVQLPEGFSIPEGTKIRSVSQFESRGVPTIMVFFESEQSPEAIIEHFRKQAEAAGFKIDIETKTATGLNVMSVADKNGRRFMAGADRHGDKTSGQVTISR